MIQFPTWATTRNPLQKISHIYPQPPNHLNTQTAKNMFDKDALNKLNSLKDKLPKEQKVKKSPALSNDFVPLVGDLSNKVDSTVRKSKKQNLFAEIFLKEGNPTADEAFKRLRSELVRMRHRGIKIVRVIHGYGSSGRGGEIKRQMAFELELLVNDGRIESFISGEKFNCFNTEAVDLVNRFVELKKDPDYRFENPGITIVEL